MLKKIGAFLLSAVLTFSLIVLFYLSAVLVKSQFYSYLIFVFLFIISLVAMREWKKNKASSLGIIIVLCVVVGWLCLNLFRKNIVYACQGLHNEFNSVRLLDKADVVAKVKVVSNTRTDSLWEDLVRYYLTRDVATVELLESIKGETPDKFTIKYPKERKRQDCSQLRKGNIIILFLEEDKDGYRFSERLNEKLLLKSEKTSFDFGKLPRDKLLAELMDLAANSISYQRTNAISDIGRLKDKRALDYLRSLTYFDEEPLYNGNAFVRAEALTARIRINDAPQKKELLDLFQYMDEEKKTNNACLGHNIFKALNESVVVDKNNETEIVEKLNDFDYVDFLSQINIDDKCLSWDMKEISGIYRKLADERSMPNLKKLIDYKDFEVRLNATWALNNIFQEEKYPEPKTTKFHNFRVNEKKYINYWKQKLSGEVL